MQQVAIQDANILIDLVKTGLFAHCLALDYQFMTTDLILAELYDSQIAIVKPHIDSGKFQIAKISSEDLDEIHTMSLANRQLSEQDWSAIYYANKKKAVLLSGDKYLRKVAESRNIEVHGVFWLLDHLANENVLSKKDCIAFIKSLFKINSRLPIKERDDRIAKWSTENL